MSEAGRVHLVGAVPLLHPEPQTVEEMLQAGGTSGCRGTCSSARSINEPAMCAGSSDHVNEFPWNWTPSHVEEYFGDLRSTKHFSQSTLRGQQSALRHFTSYISNSEYG
jgi:integrase/recombinase XerD